MVDLEKLAELNERATEPPWIDDGRGIGEEGSATWELTRGDRALMVELRNNCAAIVEELRAARELATHLREWIDVLSFGTESGGAIGDTLRKYEATREAAGSSPEKGR